MDTALNGGWRPCRDGELRHLVEHLTTRRRLRLAWGASLVAALVVGSGLTAAEVAARLYVKSASAPATLRSCTPKTLPMSLMFSDP